MKRRDLEALRPEAEEVKRAVKGEAIEEIWLLAAIGIDAALRDGYHVNGPLSDIVKRKLLEEARGLDVATWWNERILPRLNRRPRKIRKSADRTGQFRRLCMKFKDFPDRVEAEVEKASDFLVNNKWFTVDWILKEKNARKLLEGNYEEESNVAVQLTMAWSDEVDSRDLEDADGSEEMG